MPYADQDFIGRVQKEMKEYLERAVHDKKELQSRQSSSRRGEKRRGERRSAMATKICCKTLRILQREWSAPSAVLVHLRRETKFSDPGTCSSPREHLLCLFFVASSLQREKRTRSIINGSQQTTRRILKHLNDWYRYEIRTWEYLQFSTSNIHVNR